MPETTPLPPLDGCRWCGAPPGSRCTSPRGRRLPIESHDARHTAWNQTNRTEEPT